MPRILGAQQPLGRISVVLDPASLLSLLKYWVAPSSQESRTFLFIPLFYTHVPRQKSQLILCRDDSIWCSANHWSKRYRDSTISPHSGYIHSIANHCQSPQSVPRIIKTMTQASFCLGGPDAISLLLFYFLPILDPTRLVASFPNPYFLISFRFPYGLSDSVIQGSQNHPLFIKFLDILLGYFWWIFWWIFINIQYKKKIRFS